MKTAFIHSALMVALVVLSAFFGALAWETYDTDRFTKSTHFDKINLVERAREEIRLNQYSNEVALASKDSLIELFRSRVKTINRIKYIPRRVDTLIIDTGKTCVQDSSLKLLMIADTTCNFKLDSTDGELTQCRYDLNELEEKKCEPPSITEKIKSFSLTFSTGFITGYTTCTITQ